MDVTTTSTDLIIALPVKADVATFTDEKAFEDLYEKIVKKVGEHVPDVSTKAGRDAIASLAYKVARTKTTLDKQGKDLTEEWRKNTSKVNATRNTISDRLEALQKTVRKPLTDWEIAEDARIAKHQAALDKLLSYVTLTVQPSEELRAMVAAVDATVVDDSWDEFRDRAELAKADALAALRRLVDIAEKQEADARELAELRAEREAREAAEQAKRDEEERAEQERQAEEQRKADAERIEREAREQAERDAQARIDAAEREAREANERAERAAADERQRIADEQAAQLVEQQRREADIEHRRKINNTVVNALVACAEISPDQAKKIVAHLVSGLIPNVTFTY
ncbi:hypothetical protein B9J07_12855 [Sinorhizobium sp. LM21]|uniref:hypothetical protein n=1 Tax=Sinorhizobium phage phiLM21 TaxID=1524882 RepID=UPI0004E5D2C3|nr:hypothetical protein AWJ26_gp10 [Sinorhizobium phage phiLM21]AII27762.1 hypothetical protein phiLM21_p010 [Sinorhizobium phage phiLM21]OWZ93526.1 hypothetical protein B9J07_12855 [Sinorhizobium sp. LM21]